MQQKVNVMVLLRFEHEYYDAAVKLISHYPMGTP